MTFETRLLDELQQIVALNPAPERTRSWRPVVPAAAAAALVAAIVVAVLVISSSGGGPAAAYAVDKAPDGTVTVEINSLRDASGLERKLADAGVPAKVDYLQPGTTCAPGRYKTGGDPGGKLTVGQGTRVDGGPSTFTVDPHQIASGQTLVVTASEEGGLTNVSTAVASGSVGPCTAVKVRTFGPQGAPGSGPTTAPAPSHTKSFDQDNGPKLQQKDD